MARDYLRLYARSIARDLTIPSLSEITPLALAGLPTQTLEASSPAELAFAEPGE
jgi:hypothetical protein